MKRSFVLVSCAFLLAATVAPAATVEILPSKDNTLFEDVGGALSNGAGTHMFAGTTAEPELRRAVLAFDVAGSVPAGATITGVTLTMNMSKTIHGPAQITLHRLLADWGEGSADAPGEEGGGATAAGGDATWLHTFSPSQFWLSPGGDFDPVPSATTSVVGQALYTWGPTPAMLADVEDWRANPGGNFGWLVLGDEQAIASAKRFDTRESTLPPVLTVTYDGPGAVPATTPVGAALLALMLALASLAVRRRQISRRILAASPGPSKTRPV